MIEISTEQGCASYLVFGLGTRSTGLGNDPAVMHTRTRAVGLYANQGSGARIGAGYLEESTTRVDPARAQALVETATDADGRYQVSIRTPTPQEKEDEKSREVLCLYDGLSARRVR